MTKMQILSAVALAVATSLIACAQDPSAVVDTSDGERMTRSVQQALDSESCSSTETISGTFQEHCLLAGGNKVVCSSGSAMCCRECTADEGCVSHCFDRISDVRPAPKSDYVIPSDPPPTTISPPKPAPIVAPYPGVVSGGTVLK